MNRVTAPVAHRESRNSDEFIHCSNCKVKDCSILQHCGTACLDVISDAKKMCHFVPGQRILMEGNFAKGVYFIEEGKVKIYKTNSKGQEVILRFAGPGDIIGYNSTEDSSEYHVSAISISDAVTCFIDAVTFQRLMNEFPAFSLALLQYYKKQLQITEQKTLKMATMTVPEKVADALLIMYQAYGASGETRDLNLTLSRQDMANLAGTTKEQVSKAISDLKNQGIIDARGKHISLIDLDALRKIAKF